MTVRVGQAGLGEWGKNLARNFGDLTELTWLCDPANGKHEEFQSRYPHARWAESFDEMLGDPELDAVVIVTAHSQIDYARLVDDASLVVDLRNATGKAGVASDKVWKL